MIKFFTALTFALLLIGGTIGAHEYFAKASDLQEYQSVTNRRFMHIDRRAMQKRLWDLERAFNFVIEAMPPAIRKERRELIADIDRMKQDLDKAAKEG